MDWDAPVLTDLYADVLDLLKERDTDLAQMLDPAHVTVTNPGANWIRWNSANGRFEIYNGVSWGALTATYNINVSHLGGAAAATYAPLASPALTGNPTAPTQAAGDNSTKIATTAFVTAAFFPSGTRMLFQQTAAPTGWTKESSATYNDVGLRITTGTVTTGGATAFSSVFGSSKNTGAYTLTTTDIPAHSHTGTTGNNSVGHTHSGSTGGASADHTHTYSGSTGGISANHTHGISAGFGARDPEEGNSSILTMSNTAANTIATGTVSADHTHAYSGTSSGISADHSHSFTTGGVSANHTHDITTNNTGGGGSHLHSLSLDLKFASVIIAQKD